MDDDEQESKEEDSMSVRPAADDDIDPSEDGGNATRYTHARCSDAAPWMGCELFEPRKDEDIQNIARELSVHLHAIGDTSPPHG